MAVDRTMTWDRGRLRQPHRNRRRRTVDDVVLRRGLDVGRRSRCSTCCRTRRRRAVDRDGPLPAPVRACRRSRRPTRCRRSAAPTIVVDDEAPRSPAPTSRRRSPRPRRSSPSARCTLSKPGQPFAAGHESAGVTAPGAGVVPRRRRDRAVLRSVRADRQPEPDRRDGRGRVPARRRRHADEDLHRRRQVTADDLGRRRAAAGRLGAAAAGQRGACR